jgi:hypothetical protein
MFNKESGEDEISLAPDGARDIFHFTQHPAPFSYTNEGSFPRCKEAKKYS